MESNLNSHADLSYIFNCDAVEQSHSGRLHATHEVYKSSSDAENAYSTCCRNLTND